MPLSCIPTSGNGGLKRSWLDAFDEAAHGHTDRPAHEGPLLQHIREDVIDEIAAVLELQKSLHTNTLFLAVRIIERFCSLHPVRERHMKLVTTVACIIAMKFEEGELLYPLDDPIWGLARGELELMEVIMLTKLEFKLHIDLASHHLEQACSLQSYQGERERRLVNYIAQMSLLCEESVRWFPKHHAAAVVVFSNWMLHRPLWNKDAVLLR